MSTDVAHYGMVVHIDEKKNAFCDVSEKSYVIVGIKGAVLHAGLSHIGRVVS